MRITIPKEVVELLGIEQGGVVGFYLMNDNIMIGRISDNIEKLNLRQ